MIDWKISAGAILGVLLSVLLAHLLTKRRESEKILNNEIVRFKESMMPLLKELESPDASPTLLITQYYPENDAAARKLVIHLPKHKKKKFEKCWVLYTQLYHEKKALGLTGLIATEVDDLSKANAGTPEGIQYIYDQTAKRRGKAINIINEAICIL